MKIWQLILAILAFAFVFAVGLLTFNFVLMPRLVHRHVEVRVPDLIGLQASEAYARAEASGLVMDVRHNDAHPTAPPGQVIDQRPLAGASIRKARTIAVVLSSGPPIGSVPLLTGLTGEQAESTLQRQSFKTGRTLVLRRAGTVAGAVGMQSPATGARLRKGERVDLLRFDPPLQKAYLMPDLRGQSLFAVRDRIGRTGCPLAPVRYRRNADLPPNTIVGQTPRAGTRIMKGETIALVASTR